VSTSARRFRTPDMKRNLSAAGLNSTITGPFSGMTCSNVGNRCLTTALRAG
jgi:hypothetical protein